MYGGGNKNVGQKTDFRNGSVEEGLMAEASQAFRGAGVRDSETFLRFTLTDSFPAFLPSSQLRESGP